MSADEVSGEGLAIVPLGPAVPAEVTIGGGPSNDSLGLVTAVGEAPTAELVVVITLHAHIDYPEFHVSKAVGYDTTPQTALAVHGQRISVRIPTRS